ncbi:MAG: cupin domain-containing protein [Myxococcota bacterium]
MVKHPEFHSIDHPSEGAIVRRLADGLTAHIFPGEQAMLSVVDVDPGAEGALHAHPEEQWGLCLEGSGVRVQGDVEVPFRKGDFWRTPAHVPHTLRSGPEGCRVLDIFAPPRAEYRRGGSGFGEG